MNNGTVAFGVLVHAWLRPCSKTAWRRRLRLPHGINTFYFAVLFLLVSWISFLLKQIVMQVCLKFTPGAGLAAV